MTEQEILEESGRGYTEGRFLLENRNLKPMEWIKRYWRNMTLQSKLQAEFENIKIMREVYGEEYST